MTEPASEPTSTARSRSRLTTVSKEGSPRGRRRVAPMTVLFDIGAPIGLFYALRALGFSEFAALLTSGVAPGLSTMVQVVRTRRLDRLAVFIVGVTVLTAGAALIGGSPRFLLAKEGVVTGAIGGWLLANSWADRPVVFAFARALLEGRVGPSGESWDVLWERLPGFRRIWRVAGVIWGGAIILDATIRFVFAYTLPVDAVPGLNGALYGAMFVLLQVVTNIYYIRAGLYDPRAELYAPLRPDADPETKGAAQS